jgi:hypothetical protein
LALGAGLEAGGVAAMSRWLLARWCVCDGLLHRSVGHGPRRAGLLRGDPHWKFVGEIKKSGSSSGKAHNAVPTCRLVCPGLHRAAARRVRGRALGGWGGGLASRGPFYQLFGGCGSPSGGEVNCKQKQHSFHAPLWCGNT